MFSCSINTFASQIALLCHFLQNQTHQFHQAHNQATALSWLLKKKKFLFSLRTKIPQYRNPQISYQVMSKPTEKAGADILYTCRMLIQRKTHACWIKTSHSLPKYTQKRQLMTHLWKDCTKGRLGLPMTDFLQRVFSTRNKKKIHKIITAITKNLVLHWHHCTH